MVLVFIWTLRMFQAQPKYNTYFHTWPLRPYDWNLSGGRLPLLFCFGKLSRNVTGPSRIIHGVTSIAIPSWTVRALCIPERIRWLWPTGVGGQTGTYSVVQCG